MTFVIGGFCRGEILWGSVVGSGEGELPVAHLRGDGFSGSTE